VIAQTTGSSSKQWGKYGCSIGKCSTDGDVTRIYQRMTKLGVGVHMEEKYYTFSMDCKTSTADQVRLFYYDGSTYTYSNYHTGGGTWESLMLSFENDSTASELRIGVEFSEVVSAPVVYDYIDCAMLVRGINPTDFDEHPLDRTVICQDWDEDGTDIPIRGANRVIPFEMSGTTTGGSATETAAYTLTHGCRQILHVSLNFYSYTGTIGRTKIDANNFSTTGFDVVIQGVAMNVEASKDFVITGVIWCVGWDDDNEQYKTV